MPSLTLEEIKTEAKNSWGGQTGIDRMNSVENIILTRVENYSKILGIPKEEILAAFEKCMHSKFLSRMQLPIT